MRFGIREGEFAQPSHDLSMLGHHEREKSFSHRVGLPLERTKLVSHQVWVLGCEYDVAFFAELGCEIMIGSMIALDHVFWASFQTVLAYHHRTPLAGLNVLRHEEDAIGEELRVHVENDFVPRPFLPHRIFFGNEGREGANPLRNDQ